MIQNLEDFQQIIISQLIQDIQKTNSNLKYFYLKIIYYQIKNLL